MNTDPSRDSKQGQQSANAAPVPPLPDDGQNKRSMAAWMICGLLLLATMINYMDRQTLANVSKRITDEFRLTEEQYGTLESNFGYAFALGTLIFGFVADRVNIRILYPLVLVAWSTMGFLTGYADTYEDLLWCRTLLGLFEAGHWPCALRTTQQILHPRDRTLGNSVLQSGASVGAIITPLVMALALTDAVGSWRPAFKYIGGTGALWAILWWFSTRGVNMQTVSQQSGGLGQPPKTSVLSVIFSRRFLILLVVVVCINMCWQLYRAWMVKFLQSGRGFSEKESLSFMSVYYIFTDVGCIASGLATSWLFRNGMAVTRARLLTFTFFATLCLASVAIPWLGHGYLLLGVLLLQAMGSLGIFPCYYSFAQALSKEHQGKVSGISGAAAWVFSSPMQKIFGRMVDQSGSYDAGLVAVACLPMLAAVVLIMFWGREAEIDDVPHTSTS